MSAINEIDVSAAKSLLNSGDKTVVLDARDVASYRQGHVDGAMLAHDGLIASLVDKGDKTVPILVYCYRGNTSVDVAKRFASCGFDRVYSLIGGYVQWEREHG